MSLELATRFPELQIIVEDRPAVLEQGLALWMDKMPDAIQDGRVRLQEHNFFQDQPTKGAEVYFLRYIL